MLPHVPSAHTKTPSKRSRSVWGLAGGAGASAMVVETLTVVTVWGCSVGTGTGMAPCGALVFSGIWKPPSENQVSETGTSTAFGRAGQARHGEDKATQRRR